MLTLSSLGERELSDRLDNGSLVVRTGPFCFRIRSSIDSIAEGLSLLYPDYPLADPDSFADFSVSLDEGKGLHRFWRRQARFCFDGKYPFEPLPISNAYPLLEWSMNWCISTQMTSHLMLHAAVIERNECAVIMPAPPSSGKSTLCAGLVSRGWRLLSDELALVSLSDQTISPLARPISLKNESIQVIKSFAPDAVFNRITHDTNKGSVTHMKVPAEHLKRVNDVAKPCWVVFPKYVRDSSATLTAYSKAQSMLDLGRNSFNYSILGLAGFEALSKVVSASKCYQFAYSRLDDAVSVFDALVTEATGSL